MGAFDIKRNARYLTHTGDGLIAAWPKTGSSIDGGWKVVDGRAADAAGIAGIPDERFNVAGSFDVLPFPDTWVALRTLTWEFVTTRKEEAVLVPLWEVIGTLRVGYDVKRTYQEHVRFTLEANVQPIVTMPGEDEILKLSVNGADVGEAIDGEIPIGDVRRRQYFTTERGLNSVEYLIALARAHLLVRSRAVEVEFQCRFERAVNLSCRKNARLFDGRLPGGQAIGKVINYSFSANGDTGELIGSVTIGCAIGYGGAVTEVPGYPIYAEEGYVDTGYQQYLGQLIVLGPGDVGYGPPGGPPADDGVDLLHGMTKAHFVMSEGVINKHDQQKLMIAGNTNPMLLTTQQFGDQVRGVPEASFHTRVFFHIKPVEGGPFDSVYDIAVSELEVPAMINLEAAS